MLTSSAKAFALGASLVAFALSGPVVAEVGDSETRGISTGSALGISTGSALGISTGSTLGISTGSVRGISTGSLQGISTGSVRGISTGSLQGISTGSVRGISTGSLQGISTGSLQGISTGSLLGISTGSVLGISTGSVLSSPVLLAGPIEQINVADGYFKSLGQTVYADSIVLGSLSLGDYVGVTGAISAPGEMSSDQVFNFGGGYVAGATQVLVTGLPTAVDYRDGTTTVGALTVDYTSALSGRFDGIGAAVTVFGTQPQAGGKLLARELHDSTDVIF